MSSNYRTLVNSLRDRFNEPHMTALEFTGAVGQDQLFKDAINLAYHDILNAEMEWPFLHLEVDTTIISGVRSYELDVNSAFGGGSTLNADIKEIDWESFYINPNPTITPYGIEAHTVPSVAPYTVTVDNPDGWFETNAVLEGLTLYSPVDTDPGNNEYVTLGEGVHLFSSSNAGASVRISYFTSTTAEDVPIITTRKLFYLDYDVWRQRFLQQDLDATPSSGYGTPFYVYKPQIENKFNVSPVPDISYRVTCECWVDANDMSVGTDTCLIPTRFESVLLNGASKYMYEFREDPQMAKTKEQQFIAGISRMRTELINRNFTMNAGFRWRKSTMVSNSTFSTI